MKKTFVSLMGMAAIAFAVASCNGQKSSSTVQANDSAQVSAVSDGILAIDSTASYLTWKGFKPGGEHYGKLPVSTGEISVVEGKLKGGNITVAMNGIVVEDLQGEMAAQVKAHLENEDFFEVATYPTARFELTDIPADGIAVDSIRELKGNLTLKGVTKNITIPVSEVSVNQDGKYVAKSATFRINRADWNVKYGSKSFFTGLGDKFINDEIELSFVLQAK